MLPNNSARRLKDTDLRVSRESHPEWSTAAERLPKVGDSVFCASGRAEVVRVLGKTSDGSRLLELKLLERDAAPFFAAASNVLVAPS